MLLIESDAGGAVAEAELDGTLEACRLRGRDIAAVRATDIGRGGRAAGGPAQGQPVVERLGIVLIEDVGVPSPRIPELLVAVEAIATGRTATPVFGHAGDGNFHPLVTFDRSIPTPRPGPRPPSTR